MEPTVTQKLQELETKIDGIQLTLSKMRRTQRHASIARIAYWSFIILLSIGALWFVKPFFSEIADMYGFDVNSLAK